MEGAVGADREEGIVTRLEAFVGFLVLGVERLVDLLQCCPAIGESFQLRALQILIAIRFPIGFRDQVIVERAVFLRVDQIQCTGLDGVGDLDIE